VIKETIALILIGSGSSAYLDPLYIVAEGEIVLQIIPGRMGLLQSVVVKGKTFSFMGAALLNGAKRCKGACCR
jgi:hypothetical protein